MGLFLLTNSVLFVPSSKHNIISVFLTVKIVPTSANKAKFWPSVFRELLLLQEFSINSEHKRQKILFFFFFFYSNQVH